MAEHTSYRMSPLIVLLWIQILPSVVGHGSMIAILENLQRLDSDVIHLRMEVPEIEGRVDNKLALAQNYLETKLINTIVPKYIDDKVEKSLSDIFSGRGIDDMVSGYVMNQLGVLRGNFHQMRRKHDIMSRRLRDLEKERDLWRKRAAKDNQLTQEVVNIGRITTGLKEDLNHTQEMLKDIETGREQWEESLLKESQQVTKDIEHLDEVTSLLRQDLNNSLELMVTENDDYHQKMNFMADIHQHLNKTMVIMMEDLNTTRQILEQNIEDLMQVNGSFKQTFMNMQKCECQGISKGQALPFTSSATTSISSPTLTSSTPPYTIQRDMDLLVAPHTKDYFHRLHLNRNSLSNFPLRLEHVDCVVYISSIRSLLISEHESKHRLASFNIDTYSFTTVRDGIGSYGMAVDELRQMVFMTVRTPTYSISRMEVGGWIYRVIVGTGNYGDQPLSIAVDPRQRMIYACVSNKLLSVDYDGHNVQTLYTGSGIYSVTLDLAGGMLYFNSDEKLMGKSLSNTITKQVFHLGYNPYTIIHYNSSIYTLNVGTDQVSVIYLGSKSHNIAENKLQIVKGSDYSMCLIPVVGN